MQISIAWGVGKGVNCGCTEARFKTAGRWTIHLPWPDAVFRVVRMQHNLLPMIDVVPHILGDIMRLSVVIFSFSLLTGCAFNDVVVNPPSGISANLSGGERRVIVVYIPFADDRQNRNRCGMQKNGYNMDTASAICSSDPAIWLANLLKEELKTAGFTVKTDEANNKTSALKIRGSLLKLFVEPVIGFTTVTLETDIHIKLLATSDNGLIAERSFFVKGSQSGLAATASNFQASVDNAVKKVIKDIVSDILTLMNRYPELGMHESDYNLTNIAFFARGQ